MNEFKLVKVQESKESMIFNLVKGKQILIIYKVYFSKHLGADKVIYKKIDNRINPMVEVLGLNNLCALLFLNNISHEIVLDTTSIDEEMLTEYGFLKTPEHYVKLHPEVMEVFKSKLQKECEKDSTMKKNYDTYLETYSTYISNIASLDKRK